MGALIFGSKLARSRLQSRKPPARTLTSDRLYRDGGIALHPQKPEILRVMGSPTTPPFEVNSGVRSPVRTTRILIADDNAIIRTVMHALIEVNAALEVCGEAVTGPDAIQQAQELKPDMVLLDLRMPGMNGLQVAPLIKQALPGVFIVLFTMLEKDISETLRTAAHIDLVLRKPQGLDTLLRSIQDFVPAN